MYRSMFKTSAPCSRCPSASSRPRRPARAVPPLLHPMSRAPPEEMRRALRLGSSSRTDCSQHQSTHLREPQRSSATLQRCNQDTRGLWCTLPPTPPARRWGASRYCRQDCPCQNAPYTLFQRLLDGGSRSTSSRLQSICSKSFLPPPNLQR